MAADARCEEVPLGRRDVVARNSEDLRGVPVGDGSQRAMDLDTKLRYLREAHPDRQLTMATGTPVSNTV
ncbi:MAG TPA: hypothetical protein VMU73_08820, partial [Gaiellaceae bacterium]|nr:hypothetical protein [Gaiellaceae bacterium]